MSPWWFSLGTRERWFIASGTYITVVAALILLLVEPVYGDLIAAREYLAREVLITAELEAKAREAHVLYGRADAPRKRLADQSLFAAINTTAGEAGIGKSIVRITPRDENDVALVFDTVSFDQLAAWLVVISTDLGVEVSQAAVSRQRVPGFVTGSLTLVYCD